MKTQRIHAESIYNALKAGYRLIDCVCDYENEEQVEIGRKKALDDKIL